MKCTKCNSKIIVTPDKNLAICPKCIAVYQEKELKNMFDVEMMNTDHYIYKRNMKYRG